MTTTHWKTDDWKTETGLDMWGNDEGNPMYGIPPSDDPYWEDRHTKDFDEESYWLRREAEYWFVVAKSMYVAAGGHKLCSFGAKTLFESYSMFFEEKNYGPLD